MNLLELEGINAALKQRSKKGEVYIQITNWENYWKCYKIGMFDLCKRKKEHFLDCSRKAKYHVLVKKGFTEKILNGTNQRQLSLATNIDTPTMCNSIMHKCFTLENLIIICKVRKISINELKENTEKIRVGNSTEIEDNEFIDFVLSRYINFII